MQGLKVFRTLAMSAAALIVTVGLAPKPAFSASTVDITYDLGDTTLEGLWGSNLQNVIFVSNEDPVNGTIAGSMKIQYVSNSQSSIPIQSGPVSLLSLELTASSLTPRVFTQSGTQSRRTVPYPFVAANLHWQLTGGPVAGNLTSGSALTGLSGVVHLTGTAKCALPSFGATYCGGAVGIPYGVTAQIDRYYTGPINLAGSIGPYGGAQSTRHTVTGNAPVSVRFGIVFALANDLTHGRYGNQYGGAQLVGREILREADGHDPKVIPEPGTLLLLGAGTTGLALVGRATRRRG